jgi:PQQ-like domain
VLASAGAGTSASTNLDWRTFDYTASRTGVYPATTGITAANAKRLVRRQVGLDGTADSSPIYLHAALVRGKAHNVFFVTTTYGKTEAIDASSGTVLWRFTPPGYSSWAGSAQITTATPVIGDDRAFLYAAAPNGRVYKLSVADGHVLWSVSITRLPSREKIASALNYAGGRVIATTGGYIGDAPPYQGHVAVIDAGSGRLLHVWNSLCSNRAGLLDPHSCSASDSAIWGRAGAVVDPSTGDLLVATGNAPWDGATNWGDAVIRLSSGATAIRGNYTPVNTEQLNSSDTDLGSTSPVILDATHIAQGGKDGKIRVLGVGQMSGASPHKGGELQIVSTPGSTDLFTAPAVWRQSSSLAWLFVADGAGTAAFRYSGGHLTQAWSNGTAGTSPVVAGGLLWVFDPSAGGVYVYRPTTGALVTTLASGSGHWNSPIVADGRVALPEGDANNHRTSGVLDIWSLR